MSLILYFDKKDLGVDYADVDIPFCEDSLDEDIDFKEELDDYLTFGLANHMTYELAPVEIKTYLSVKYRVNNVYDISLCGPEIVLKLLKLREGRIYAPYMAMNHTIVKYMEKDFLDIKKATGVAGKYIKIKTIEQLLRSKHRTLEAELEQNFNNIIGIGFGNQINKSESDCITKVNFKEKLQNVAAKEDINVEINIEFTDEKTVILIGHTGDMLHDLMINAIARNEFIESEGKQFSMIYLDIYGAYHQLKEMKERSLVFTNNIFELLFQLDESALIVIDNIDALYRRDKKLTEELCIFINESNDEARYLIFSRLFSNMLFGLENFEIANLCVNKVNNSLNIQVIKEGEE